LPDAVKYLWEAAARLTYSTYGRAAQQFHATRGRAAALDERRDGSLSAASRAERVTLAQFKFRLCQQ